MNAVSQPLGPCRCDSERCEAIGTKLNKLGHISRLCTCFQCQGTRNKKKGQRGQAKGHRALGGIGFTPSNEESHGGYDVRVQVEHKTGEQVPASFRKFITLDWTRRALNQAERAVRVGDGSHPSVMIDGRWLIVDCKAIGPERRESLEAVLATRPEQKPIAAFMGPKLRPRPDTRKP